jgi:hypothetical protein
MMNGIVTGLVKRLRINDVIVKYIRIPINIRGH